MKSTQQIDSFFEHKVLIEAAELARAGMYLDAENHLIGSLNGKNTSIAVLDLLARIRAQQGRLAEAESLWKQGLQTDPLNEACLSGLQRIAHIQKPLLITSGGKILICALAIILILLSLWAIRNALSDLQSKINEVKSTLSQEGVIQSFAKDEFANSRTSFLQNLSINIPGIQMRTEKGVCVISFKSGLFSRGTMLRPKERGELTTLGSLLEPYKGRITIHVTGYTDDLPMPSGKRYLDNISLGLSRALVVVEHLRSTTGLTGVPFTTSGADHIQYKHIKNTNRLSYRTVTISVIPIQK